MKGYILPDSKYMTYCKRKIYRNKMMVRGFWERRNIYTNET